MGCWLLLTMDCVFKMIRFALKMTTFVLKMMNIALKMMNFVLKMMNFAFKLMNFVLKMMTFALKRRGSRRTSRARPNEINQFSVHNPSVFSTKSTIAVA